ncbi:MAG: chlorophyll synthesis pathway protein BchC [Beijerinckiaceae bacterium]
MRTLAVVLEEPRRLALGDVGLIPPAADDAVIDVLWSGISTGTEKLLWSGEMPAFPGLSYPLVPGYESVGRVADVGVDSGLSRGQLVFAPGSRGFTDVSGLFGGAARRLVVKASRLIPLPGNMGEDAALLALAGTAAHAIAIGGAPDLLVGHGVVGRLIARVAIAMGHPAPTVWETNPLRRTGTEGYTVLDPAEDNRCDYRSVMDASGDVRLVDRLIQRLAKGGTLTLAGFYQAPVSFAFPPAFMRELTLKIAAEWRPADMDAVLALITDGKLSLAGLITHRLPATDAPAAYAQAFSDPACLKMILDWTAVEATTTPAKGTRP